MSIQATETLRTEIAVLEKELEAKRTLLERANKAAIAVLRQACSHKRKRHTGTGRHGSDKGDEYEECIDCGASFRNGTLD